MPTGYEVLGLEKPKKKLTGYDVLGMPPEQATIAPTEPQDETSFLGRLPMAAAPFKRPQDVGIETVVKKMGVVAPYMTGEKPLSGIPADIAEAAARKAPELFGGGKAVEGKLPRSAELSLDAIRAVTPFIPVAGQVALTADIAHHPVEAVKGLGKSTVDLARTMASAAKHEPPPLDIRERLAETPFTETLNLATPALIAAGVAGAIPKGGGYKPRILKSLQELEKVKQEFPPAPNVANEPKVAPQRLEIPSEGKVAATAPEAVRLKIEEMGKKRLAEKGMVAQPPEIVRGKETAPPEGQPFVVGGTNLPIGKLKTKAELGEPTPTLPEGAFPQVPKPAEVLKTPEAIRAITEQALFGEKNALFTKSRRDTALQRLKEKSSQLRTGIDPTVLKDWVEIGGYYVEGGIREFGAWSQKMIEDLGDDIKPHLQKIYEETLAALPRQFSENAVKETINLERLNIDPEAKIRLEKTISEIQPELQKAKGAKVTHEEVIEAAKTSEILQKATSREATLKREAALLKTRQQLAAVAEKPDAIPELIKTLEIVKSHASDLGRELGALRIDADPSLSSIKVKVLKRLLDIGKTADELIEASKGVDFNNAKQLADFYRKFVKPTLPEIIDEYRYINLLSSPRTHIVNAFSNILQVGLLRPATRLATGAVDIIGSKLRGVEQEYYVRQVPAYTKGAVNALPEAGRAAMKALRGELFVERPDIARIPTQVKPLKPFSLIPRAMEAMDVFFRTLAENGELESLLKGQKLRGKAPTEAEIANLKTKAKTTAEELVFRKKPDPQNLTGQGSLLSTIDEVTNQVYAARRLPLVKWFVPFVQTVANITKQGIEYSPAGPLTIFKSAAKTEQLGKALVGSTVFAGAAALALDGRLTWGVPKNKDEKQAFYDAGMQAYSIKVGDKWYSYSKLGPLAYPIAMAAAVQFYTKENPSATTDSELKKITSVLGGMAEFFADQSYVEGIGDIWRAIDGRVNFASVVENLATQVIPLSSLQRWINTSFLDPVFRKAEKGFSVEAIIENLKKSIVGLSQDLPLHKTAKGVPAIRPLPLINAFSPIQIRPEVPDAVARYQRVKAVVRRKKERDVRRRELKEGMVR